MVLFKDTESSYRRKKVAWRFYYEFQATWCHFITRAQFYFVTQVISRNIRRSNGSFYSIGSHKWAENPQPSKVRVYILYQVHIYNFPNVWLLCYALGMNGSCLLKFFLALQQKEVKHNPTESGWSSTAFSPTLWPCTVYELQLLGSKVVKMNVASHKGIQSIQSFKTEKVKFVKVWFLLILTWRWNPSRTEQSPPQLLHF